MSAPYKRKEVIGDATIYLGDCLEILPTLPKVDAVITDPPYGISYTHSGGGGLFQKDGTRLATKFGNTPIHGDDAPFDPAPILSISNRFCMWGANHYATRIPAEAGHRWLVWDKGFNEVPTKSFSHCELAWLNQYGALRMKKHVWDGCFRQGVSNKIPRAHPTEKPVEVMEWCLSFFDGADVICDPYMGVGTTGRACLRNGRKFIGIEIEPKYFDIACRRIEDAQRQQRMFA